MAETRIQARVPDETAAWLAERDEDMHTGSVHLQARLELGMWHTAIAAELRRIRLTLNQANCLADILNGTLMQPGISGALPLVYMDASDAFHLVREAPIADDEVTYGAKWGIDEDRLLAYLRTLGPTADHALHYAITRWWKTDAKMTAEGWASVGLTIVPTGTGEQDTGA